MRSQPAVLFCCNPDRSVTGIFPLLLNRLIRLIDREQEQNRNRTFFFFSYFPRSADIKNIIISKIGLKTKKSSRQKKESKQKK